MPATQKLHQIFTHYTRSTSIHQAVLSIENGPGDFTFHQGHGGQDLDTPFLMASITKLFTTTCILALLQQGKLSLDDPLTTYFDRDLLTGLHIYRGHDCSLDLTLAHLLFQTSGLPDLYEEGPDSAKARLLREDYSLSFDQIVAGVKQLHPHFAPGSRPKAHYADVNFDLLGQVIEQVSGLPLPQAYRRFIFEPLGLTRTCLPEDEHAALPGIYYRDQLLHRPRFLISSRASGGAISTAADLMRFLKAFFAGRLFDRAFFARLSTYHPLQAGMGPISYGGGYMRVPLNGLATLFMGKGELLGHSGSTGSFAFYYPLKDLYFVGDLNQMANPALPIRLVMQLAMSA